MSWRFKVFISYCGREPIARRWVHKVLEPHLRSALINEAGLRAEEIFFDEEAALPGQRLSSTILESLRDSQLLIPVLQPLYFQSGWCRSELRWMQVRSRFVSHTGVLPLQVWDGECYQHHLQGLVPPIDLRKWSHQARAGDGLRRALGEVARLADAHLKQMSDMPWDSQWAPEQLEDAPVHVPLGEW